MESTVLVSTLEFCALVLLGLEILVLFTSLLTALKPKHKTDEKNNNTMRPIHLYGNTLVHGYLIS